MLTGTTGLTKFKTGKARCPNRLQFFHRFLLFSVRIKMKLFLSKSSENQKNMLLKKILFLMKRQKIEEEEKKSFWRWKKSKLIFWSLRVENVAAGSDSKHRKSFFCSPPVSFWTLTTESTQHQIQLWCICRHCLLSTHTSKSNSTLGTHLHAMITTHHFDFDVRIWPISALMSIT